MEKGDVDVVFLNSNVPALSRLQFRAQRDPQMRLCRLSRFFHERGGRDRRSHSAPARRSFEGEGSQYGAQRQVVWRERVLAAPPEVSEDWRFYRDLGRKLVPPPVSDFGSARELYEMARKAVPSWRGITLERLAASPSGCDVALLRR
jgi:formate dehydrogenase major subunit